MTPIRALIIDDEQHCVESLSFRLSENCPHVKIIGDCQTVASGAEAIIRLQPDLIFLDINLPDGSGFSLLDKIAPASVHVIFTTAYDAFAIKAFKFNAVDYLLKPVGDDDIRTAVDRYKHRTLARDYAGLRNVLEAVRKTGEGINKIALPTAHGHVFVSLNDIIRLQADSNYTIFFLKDGSKITVAKTLKEYDDLLSDLPFFRIHNSDIINLAFVKEYNKGKGGTVVLNDGTELEVSVRRKPLFSEKLSSLLKF